MRMTRTRFWQAKVLLLSIVIILSFLSSKVYALSDADCMDCHSDKDLTTTKDGRTVSLFINIALFKKSKHADNGCISCHEDAGVKGDEHPFPLAPVNCSNCHEKIGGIYEKSAHGQAVKRGDKLAPRCYDCHTKHDILSPDNKNSSTYPLNIPYTCGRCHHEGSAVSKTHILTKHDIVKNYSMSVHGKGLFEDGLLVTAVCNNCHTAHNIRKASDPLSSVNRKNIIDTCGKCHVGIVTKFKKSIHSTLVTKTTKKLPVCIDCHQSHTISRVSGTHFRKLIVRECGHCHEYQNKTYDETYHGRAGMLSGGARTAKCSDCHGSHNIMPATSPSSTINQANILKTCQQCHPSATAGFTSYLPHAVHSDKARYPYLYYSFWAMTGLLLAVFFFFGLHTLFWIPRSLYERYKAMKGKKHN